MFGDVAILYAVEKSQLDQLLLAEQVLCEVSVVRDGFGAFQVCKFVHRVRKTTDL